VVVCTCRNIFTTITSKDWYVDCCFYKIWFHAKALQQMAEAARPKELMLPVMVAHISRLYMLQAHLWPISSNSLIRWGDTDECRHIPQPFY
jgi:hypothetical protein